MSKSHGHCSGKETLTYRTWRCMYNRCNCKGNASYKQYGGRGIKICERWKQFENFLADMGERLPGMVLDRINGNGDYEPNNCRWVTSQQNSENKNNNHLVICRGETMPITKAARILGLIPGTLICRVNKLNDSNLDVSTLKFHKLPKFSDALVREIKASPFASTTAARIYGVSEAQVLRIRHGISRANA